MPFEELKICKILNLTALDWSAPLLSANFGDGYSAGVLSGSAAGLHKWTLSSEVLPDWGRHSVDYVLNGESQTDTRFEYLFSFIKRHISLGNRPFRIKDPRTGKFYLASFQISDSANFSFEVLAYKFFRGGIVLNQRRARNVLFNSDGSLFAAPDNFKVSPLSSTTVLFTWDAAINDNLAGYDLWFDTDDYIIQLGDVTELPFGSLVTGSVHKAKIRSRNEAGQTSDWSDTITFIVLPVGGIPVDAKPTITTPANLPSGTVGVNYSQAITVIGGDDPVTLSMTSGSLPPGLVRTNGLISGTPETADTYTFTLRATDDDGDFHDRTFTLVINPAPPTNNVTFDGDKIVFEGDTVAFS